MRYLILLSMMFTLVFSVSPEQARETVYDAYDPLHDPAAQTALREHTEGTFGFRAYRANFFLPVGVADRDYPSYVPSDDYRRIEAEYQYSFCLDLFADLFGGSELYGIAMTQHGFWQMYSDSSPFRENNYNPEVYVLIPLLGRGDAVGLKTVKLTYSHNSNGQGSMDNTDFNASELSDGDPHWYRNRSRSWNYLSAVLGFQHGSLFTDLTLWIKLDTTMFGIRDDNPDIVDYMGWGQLDLRYLWGAHQVEFMGRFNPVTGYGAVQAGWSFPFFGRESVYWYAKGFGGYGESLIDYDRYVNKFSFGLGFFR